MSRIGSLPRDLIIVKTPTCAEQNSRNGGGKGFAISLEYKGNDSMKHFAYILFLVMAMTACAPNEFEFEQQSDGGLCAEGCYNEETGTLVFDYFENVTGDRRVDILVVDDNSGSMAQEQANMATRFPNFIAGLTGIDWRLGITTTDVQRADAGDLVTFNGTNLKYIEPTTPNVDTVFNNTVQMATNGSGDERGIYAANLAVQKNEGNWIRNNSHLAVIVLSDENERSDGNNLQPLDMPANFVPNVKSELGSGKTVSFHAIVTRPNDAACLAGAGENYGTVYAELVTLTGGILGDICAADYAAQLQNIAGSIVSNVDSFGLKCAPINGVNVAFNPVPATAITHTIQNGRIHFSSAVPANTQVHLSYECKKK